MKKSFIYILLLIMCICAGCTKNKDNSQTKKNEKVVDESFTGEFGYILPNNVYDYSNLFDEVYQWIEGVKLPFEKISAKRVAFDGTVLFCEDVAYQDFENYLKDFSEKGYIISVNSDDGVVEVKHNYVYKDGIIIDFCIEEYDAENEIIKRLELYVYTGNVCGKRLVSIEDVRGLIDKKSLLKGNDYFDQYVVVEIQNESVSKKEYCEFLLHAPENYDVFDRETYPYYVITDGKDIVFCEQLGDYSTFPFISNIVKNNDGTELIVVYTEMTNNSSESAIISYIEKYKLEDKKFVLDIRHEVIGEVIIGKLSEGKMKYYLSEFQNEVTIEEGRKNTWTIKEEYDKEATLAGPKAY